MNSTETAKPASRQKNAAKLPLSLHPDNGHYFLWRGKPAILITSGEHYGAVLNADFDYVTYLDTLKKDGLNMTRVWSGSYREVAGSFGITENVLAPQPHKYLCPWKRSETPGYFDGDNKFDLNQWDEAYFRRLRDFMTAASKRGVVVEMNLFCPNYEDSMWTANPLNAKNNVNGVGNCGKDEVYTLKHPDLLAVQDAMVRKIVAELADFDNLYYEVCNEPYATDVPMEWQKHIIQTIVDAEKNLPHKHLISLNIANDKAQVVDPDPAVSIFNFHYATPPVTVGMNYGLNKVIGDNETGFRGKADVLYRSEAWEFLLAGGGLYNNLDYSFTVAQPDGRFLNYKSPGGGSPALRQQLKTLKNFLHGFDFVRMTPDKSLLTAKPARDTRHEVLMEAGKQYAVYLHGGKSESITLAIPAGTYRLRWLDPVTGKTIKSQTLRWGGDPTLEVPPYQEDIALSIRSSNAK